LTNGLPSRTNVCPRRKRTCGPQGGSNWSGIQSVEKVSYYVQCGHRQRELLPAARCPPHLAPLLSGWICYVNL